MDKMKKFDKVVLNFLLAFIFIFSLIMMVSTIQPSTTVAEQFTEDSVLRANILLKLTGFIGVCLTLVIFNFQREKAMNSKLVQMIG